MKRSASISTLILVIGTTIAAFGASSTPVVPQHPTSMKQVSPSTTAVPRPNLHQVNLRLRNQEKLIHTGLKAGKLTKDQTQTLRAGLRAVRQQEVTFFKQDGNQDLTADQTSQLNALLDKNSSTLGETTSTKN